MTNLTVHDTILLGSQSPRRSFLMKESGFDFEVRTIDVDESYPSDLAVDKIAVFIAESKADAYMDLLGDSQIGVVADTIVAKGDIVLGKPADRKEAIKMIELLSGSKHIVYTGVCIFDADTRIAFTGKSIVHFMELSRKEIEYYIDTYKPFDKAGSYGVQEWIGYTKIKKIEGSYSNIMGLPMEMVYEKLREFMSNRTV